nr:uncharacterized protein CTRU02_13558 [Colletotrichum truncatum]KAF6783322.1 hypothetical protein CTRU02_13558 [Colletotrichum truncatum]
MAMMPIETWKTIACVAALLQPHPGRLVNIKRILDKLEDASPLEKRLKTFIEKKPGSPLTAHQCCVPHLPTCPSDRCARGVG